MDLGIQWMASLATSKNKHEIIPGEQPRQTLSLVTKCLLQQAIVAQLLEFRLSKDPTEDGLLRKNFILGALNFRRNPSISYRLEKLVRKWPKSVLEGSSELKTKVLIAAQDGIRRRNLTLGRLPRRTASIFWESR